VRFTRKFIWTFTVEETIEYTRFGLYVDGHNRDNRLLGFRKDPRTPRTSLLSSGKHLSP